MRTRGFSRLFVFLAVFLMAVPVLAWGSKTLRATVSIDPAIIAGTHLKAGEYEFIVKGDQLQVRNDDSGKLVTQVAGKLMDSQKKPGGDEVVMNSDQIREIHFANKTQYFVLR